MADSFISYSQKTGEITFHGDERDFLIGIGWAGHGEGKNNPAMQDIKETGPLPVGWYSIGEPHTHPTVGPFAMRLTPYPKTEMYGRDGFLIHGAALDLAKRGEESKGCIVAARVVREKIHSLGAKMLRVV